MSRQRYKPTIDSIIGHLGVSVQCARYIYYRAFQSIRNDKEKIPWSVQQQNAIVYADKKFDIQWDKLLWVDEEKTLASHGVMVEEQLKTTFTWISPKTVEDGWTTVSHKDQHKKTMLLIKQGVHI